MLKRVINQGLYAIYVMKHIQRLNVGFVMFAKHFLVPWQGEFSVLFSHNQLKIKLSNLKNKYDKICAN